MSSLFSYEKFAIAAHSSADSLSVLVPKLASLLKSLSLLLSIND